jgi:ribose 5-phosphate isomerase B
MKIAVGSDHRGYGLKNIIKEYLVEKGYDVIDVGTDSEESVAYPVYAGQVAVKIQQGRAGKGVLVCGSGIGVCIAANKFKGIRAATVNDEVSAKMTRMHNDANIVCLSADFMDEAAAKKIIETFLNTEFEGGRHQRRVDLISEFEERPEGIGNNK